MASIEFFELMNVAHIIQLNECIEGKEAQKWLSSKCIYNCSSKEKGKQRQELFFSSMARGIRTADPLTYRGGNSHSSWSGQWAEAPVCYQLTSTLSMCLSHDHQGPQRALHISAKEIP